MDEKPLSGMGIAALLDSVENAIDATKNMRNRALPFLTALHASGFDVVQMPSGPVLKAAAAPLSEQPEVEE
jgi:hypothetical protein